MSTPTNIPETPMGEPEQDSYFKSKEKFQQQLQHIFQTTLRLTAPDQFDQLCQWMESNQYLTIDDFYHNCCDDPEKFDINDPATEYKWKGKMNYLSANVAQKLKSFVRWMTHEDRPYEVHDDFLATLTRERYLKFRHMDTLSFYQSSFHPKMPQKSFLPCHIWETLSESTKQMIIDHNKKVKLNNPTPYPSGSKTKPNPTLGKPTPTSNQVHQHSQDEPTEEPPSDTSTQTLVNQCLADSGLDPTDIQNVMSVSYANRNISSHESSRQIQTHQRYVFARVCRILGLTA